MRRIPILLFVVSLVATVALHGDEAKSKNPPTSQQSTPATQKTVTTRPAIADQVERLVLELGNPEYKRRERAWNLLKSMGEPAIPWLVPYINHQNVEIAQRVGVLMTRPKDPAIRVEAAAKLMTSADPDWMEKGVYMIFESPIEDYPRLKEITDNSTGLEQAILTPVLDQLEQWKQITERHLARREKHLKAGKNEIAEREANMHKDSLFYQAEAAYWQARDAADTYQIEHAKATSMPTTNPGS